MKKLLFLLIFCTHSFAALIMEELTWESGDTLLMFLQRHSIPLALYYELDREDKELASEIASKIKYQVLKDENENLEQVLIPISDELFIHIYKNKDNKYMLDFSPTIYELEKNVLNLTIKNSAYQDVYETSGSTTLSRALLRAFKGSINFRNIRKNDKVSLYYEQKRRLGKVYGDITIYMASVQVNKKTSEVYRFDDNFYAKSGKEIGASFLITSPISNFKRISSHFTTARFHPILKRYRAHLGTDYAAATGTPVLSAGNGVVNFIGSQNGYGKVLKIQHSSGYTTLYAHLSRFAKLKKGQSVRQGQTIGYVGSTGMSTGPHLHFGVYLNNKAINPLSVIKVAKKGLEGAKKEKFNALVKEYKQIVQNHISQNLPNPIKAMDYENFIEF
ncbi:M23 family metallopeptidase [Campylobacter sp. LR264d]|uniref:M23 family metallopeptidase n=1 Tax=Campylobacter sp. LR264d TaxID=2593544 RepID=UPI00123AAB80|nr:M23 family metallopeptidase [Campylobacter sp. LR264d]KAA6234123.1 M23 family metallopeptidase [Campylobacter sp. LR264d]